ncbi:hypothetical protein [Geopseudomonas aromaticivorans]
MSFLYRMSDALGQFASSRLPIQNVVSNDTIQLAAGLGYMTTMRMNGSFRMFGTQERRNALEFLLMNLSVLLNQPGCQLQWVTEVNPEQARNDLRSISNVSRETWRRMNVDMEIVNVLIQERERMLSERCTRENNYLSVTTNLGALDQNQAKVDAQNAFRDLGGVPLSLSAFTQVQPSKMKTLYQRHQSSVELVRSVMSASEVQQLCEVMPADSVLRELRRLYLPDQTNDQWTPALQGDRRYFAVQSKADDHTRLPHLRDQVLSSPITLLEDGVVRIGSAGAGRHFATAFMYVHPSTWMGADQLVDKLPKDFHWWTSMTLISGAVRWRNYVRSHRAMANALKIISSKNSDIVAHSDHLLEMAKIDNLLGFRMQVVTEAKTPEAAQHQIFTLISELQAWGGSLWRQDVDDPDELLKHAVPGCDRQTSYAGQTFAIPALDGIVPLPFSRPGSAWQRHLHGSLLMLTESQRLYPFRHQAAGLQKYASDLFIAPMGGGKSVMLQAIRLAYIEAYSSNELLPRAVTLDVGPSSSGLIELLKAILPNNQRWQVEYRRITEDGDDSCINPFDTQLMVFAPTTVERSFLNNFLEQLFTSPGQESPPEGVNSVIPLLIDYAFKMYLTDGSTRLKQYTPSQPGYEEVDAFVEEHGLNVEGTLTWKSLTISLFKAGKYTLAEYAQWRAVPTVPDLADVLSSTQEIEDFFGKQMVPSLGVTVLTYMKAMLVTASRSRVFSGATTFKTNARILALNLEDLLKTTGPSGIHKAGLVMLLARHATTRRWWVNDEVLKAFECDDDVREFHRKNLEREKAMPSRLDIDEYHRTKSLPAVRRQFATDRREIRKFNIHYGLASQSDEDFDSDDVELASTIMFLGSPGEQGIERIKKKFALADGAAAALRDKVRGADSKGAHILLWASTSKGILSQYVTYPLPSIYLWAFSSAPDDVSVRKRLILRLSYLPALMTLVRLFPGGSIERRLGEIQASRPELPKDRQIELLTEEIEQQYQDMRKAGQLSF